MAIIPFLLLYLPLFLSLYIITKHAFINKLQNLPPSPFPCLPIIGHLHLLKRPIHRSLLFLRLGSRPVLIVSSPSLAYQCFTLNDVVFANRPRLLIGKHFAYNFTGLSWSSYGHHWRNLRRIASLQLLSSHRLQILAGVRAEEVTALVLRLLRERDRAVDMKTAFFELTLNVMMRMIAGKRYCGEEVSDAAEAERFREIHAETYRLSGVTNIGDYLPWVKWRKLEEEMEECQRKRDEFMQYLVDEQRRKMKEDCSSDEWKKKKNLIQVLLSLQESEPECYTDEIIKGLMLVLLMAGTETSTTTMEWGLSLLLNHPEVLKKAQSEIDDRVGNSRLVNESDLANLPYLNSILNETMRMYPPAPLLVPHESSSECVVGGFRVPAGTMLLINIWAIQNDPKIWEDPRKFKPERFEGGIENGREDGFKFLPFGYGRRGCPGEGLALKLLGLALGSLIQCFEWKCIEGNKMVDMKEGTAFTLSKAQPLRVLCHPRPIMSNLLSQVCEH